MLEAVPAPWRRGSPRRSTFRRSASARGCDGQVLVWHDLLGLYAGRAPRFVKRYADLSEEIATALEAYVGDVRDGSFPAEQHTYSIPDAELEQFVAALVERG